MMHALKCLLAGAASSIVVAAAPPAPVVNVLHDGVVKALQAKDVSERLSGEAAEPVGSTPQQFVAHLKSEIEKWASVIKKAGVRAENY